MIILFNDNSTKNYQFYRLMTYKLVHCPLFLYVCFRFLHTYSIISTPDKIITVFNILLGIDFLRFALIVNYQSSIT